MDQQFPEERTGVFEPDTLLASQYFDRVRRRFGRDGEHRLMVAVLEDAVNSYLKHAGARPGVDAETFAEAEAWVESRESDWFFSFENVCAVLDLDADYIRRGLRAVKSRARAGAASPPPVDDRLRRVS